MVLTKDQVGGIIRLAVGVLSGWAIAQHWGDATLWADVGASVVVIGTAVWSYVTNHPNVK